MKEMHFLEVSGFFKGCRSGDKLCGRDGEDGLLIEF
jgi:hypothetical protein